MQSKRRYTLGGSKLAMAYCEGFVQSGGTLRSVENARGGSHIVIFNRFCSYESGTKWGRFHCRCDLSPSSALRIYALALDAAEAQADGLNRYFHDSGVPWSRKRLQFEQGGILSVNHEDILLYALTGEYLWIALEIEDGAEPRMDAENGTARGDSVCEMFLDSQGDNFMWTFPGIYQEEGGFFHRYMSVFSSVYQDMADRIAEMDRYLDTGTTPMPFLMEIAGWLGFAVSGDFDVHGHPEEICQGMLRVLVRDLYAINRIKGTKEVIRRLIRMALREEPVIVERNRIEGYMPDGTADTYQILYGASMQDVTILLRREGDERLQAQMMYLLNQFMPARSRIRLVFCPEGRRLDTHCYLDYNAALATRGEGCMDGGIRMDGTAVLK